MSKTIDERVVEMRFDNKEFERNAKESIGTLSKLKEALNISAKDSAKSLESLDKAAKSISLEGIAAGVEALQKRFSTLGIVGMRVIENITDSLMNTLGRGINFISDSIVSGGIRRAMNLENAHFQLQALLKDEVKVQEVMANANTAVDGTAYALDEAAKAASQFAASGIQAGEEMTNALRGVVGVAAMTNSDFESISRIFTTVAGNGRLMGDQLLQLGSRGLNAAATIADFVNGVRDGSKEASDEVKALVKNFGDGVKVTESDIRELVSDGQISFRLFSEAMTEAFADSAERANETFTGALSNIKSALARIGAGFISPLVAQNSEVVKLFNAVRERVNDVKKALVFDEEIGNVNALSKQFTDAVLWMAKGAADFIRNADLSKPMEIFYYWVESVKNVGKGLYSVLKPLGQAFSEVFLSFSADDVVNLSAKIEQVTQNMRLTERGSQELKDAFKGLFSVVKLVVDIFIDLVRVFVPTLQPVNTLTSGIIGLAGAVGRSLTSFTEWFRQSERIHRTYQIISDSVRSAMESFSNFMVTIGDFAIRIYQMKEVQDLLSTISKGFKQLGIMAYDAIAAINRKLVDFKLAILDLFPTLSGEGLESRIAKLAEAINNAIRNINKIDLSKGKEAFESFKNVLKSLLEVLKGNEGLDTFVTNMKNFFLRLAEAFSIDHILEKIKTFRDTVSDFVVWIKGLLRPLADIFRDFSIGGAISTAGGFGMIYAIIKIAKSFEKVANTIKAIPNILGSLNGAIKEYQNNLKADTLKKVAQAILILSGALVLLSFADTERVMQSALALSAIAGVLSIGLSKFLDAVKKTKDINDAIYMFAKAGNNLAKAVKWKAIGSAFKDFATSVLLIIGSIAAIAYMYRKDPEALQQAEMVVGVIAGALAAFATLMTLVNNKFDKGASNFAKSALGILALSGSLTLVVVALKKLFDMELPQDWVLKVGILIAIFGGVGILALALGRANSDVTSGKNNIGAGPILALAATLYVTVLALDKLFKMDLPSDYGTKLAILAGIFLALGGLVIAVGYASKLAGGALKATASILAMCIFIGTAVAALMILSIFPAEALIKGAVSLGILLTTLGLALYGAGKITTPDTYKSVLAMSLAVASITVALGVLSMVPLEKLVKAAVALGSILLALAVDFAAVGKVANDKAWLTVLSMVAVILSVSFSLNELSKQPWQEMLAAGAAMSAVLLSFSVLLKTLSSTTGIKTEKIALFLAATLAVVPITWALSELAQQPWEGLLAAATAMSAVLLVFGEILKTISSRTGIKTEKIALFLAATLAVIPIGIALYALAEQPWDRMLAAGVALSGTVVAFAAAFMLISSTKPDEMAIAAFLAGCIGIDLIAVVLYKLAEKPWENMLAAAGAISMVLLAFSGCLAVLSTLGVSVGPATQAALALDAFIVILGGVMVAIGALFQNVSSLEGYLDKGIEILVKIGEGLGRFAGSIISGVLQEVSNSFPKIGDNLSGFMTAGAPFFDGIKKINEGTVKSVGYLAAAILAITATSILEGLTSWLTGGSSMIKFGKELAEFAPYFASYAKTIEGINAETVEASANAAMSLAEMANKLPNSGGLAAKIFGDNSLSEFGKELKKFGPYLAGYAEIIKDVNPAVVEASANAAQVMADMATKLPNSGGLAAKIFGDNTLSSFGEELKKFGPYLAGYAESISGLDAGVVTNSANAAMALSELANNLPNSGGIISWFTGDNDIGSFGKSLVTFGESMNAYYVSVSQINISTLDGVIAEVKKLIEIAQGTASLDTSGMTGFSRALETMGNNGVTAFIAAFNNAIPQVTAAVQAMVMAAVNSIVTHNEQFKTVGTNSANFWITGFKSKYIEATSSGKELATKVIAALQAQVPNFLTKGTLSATQYLTGIKNKYNEATSTGTMLASKVLTALQEQVPNFLTKGTVSAQQYLTGIRNAYGEATSAGSSLANNALSGVQSVSLYDAGVNAGRGFANGLSSTSNLAKAAGAALGNAAYDAAKKALEEHSPSKKMEEVGLYGGLGFVGGLMYYVSKAANAGEELADATISGVSDAIGNISRIITEDMITDPVIRPIVDMSSVEKSVSEINSLFNEAIAATVLHVDSIANVVSSNRKTTNDKDTQNGENEKSVNYFTFNQENNSPKALSEGEIYRQTKNMFSRLEAAVSK